MQKCMQGNIPEHKLQMKDLGKEWNAPKSSVNISNKNWSPYLYTNHVCSLPVGLTQLQAGLRELMDLLGGSEGTRQI